MGFSTGMKLVMVAALLIAIVAVLLFMFQGGSSDYSDFVSSETSDARCDAKYEEWRREQCRQNTDQDKLDDLEAEADSIDGCNPSSDWDLNPEC